MNSTIKVLVIIILIPIALATIASILIPLLFFGTAATVATVAIVTATDNKPIAQIKPIPDGNSEPLVNLKNLHSLLGIDHYDDTKKENRLQAIKLLKESAHVVVDFYLKDNVVKVELSPEGTTAFMRLNENEHRQGIGRLFYYWALDQGCDESAKVELVDGNTQKLLGIYIASGLVEPEPEIQIQAKIENVPDPDFEQAKIKAQTELQQRMDNLDKGIIQADAPQVDLQVLRLQNAEKQLRSAFNDIDRKFPKSKLAVTVRKRITAMKSAVAKVREHYNLTEDEVMDILKKISVD